jgi:hypothetical protein
MSLWLDKEEIYVVPYITSKRYLDNLTDLMRTQIRGMKWDRNEKYLHIITDMWDIPFTWRQKEGAEMSASAFTRIDLNKELMRL